MRTDMSPRALAGVDERPVGALAAQANSVLMSRVAQEMLRHGVTGGTLLEMGSQTGTYGGLVLPVTKHSPSSLSLAFIRAPRRNAS